MPTRYIIIDDVDPSIHYNGLWFSNQGNQNSVGDFGPPYNGTLHGTTSNASLSFEFSGTQVRVYGSNDIRNISGVLDPAWECFVDNISIGPTAPFTMPENNWLFCEEGTLSDGPHILTVNATVLKNQTFWFDDIRYIPSVRVPLNQAAIVVDHLDGQDSAVSTIVGTVIGGLALIVFAILAILLLRRRRRQKRTPQRKVSISSPRPCGSSVRYSAKGQPYDASLFSLEACQSIEPSTASSGVFTYPTDLPPIHSLLQQSALILANPSVPPSPASESLVPLSSNTERQAGALAAYRPRRQSNPPSFPSSMQNNDSQSNVVQTAAFGCPPTLVQAQP